MLLEVHDVPTRVHVCIVHGGVRTGGQWQGIDILDTV